MAGVSEFKRNEINNAWDSLPNDIKIVDENNPQKIYYTQSLNKTSNITQESAVLNKYLLDMFGDKIDNFDSSLGTLQRIFGELGLEERYNPFITFLNLKNGKYAKIMDNKNLILLNNLYADSLVDEMDIRGASNEGLNHPIFNKNFYNTRDPEFIIKAYDYLSSPSNVNKLNLESFKNTKMLSNQDIVKTVLENKDLNNLSQEDCEEIRDALIHGGSGRTINYSNFRDPDRLKMILVNSTKAQNDRSVGARGGKSGVVRDINKGFDYLQKEDSISAIKDIMAKKDISVDELR